MDKINITAAKYLANNGENVNIEFTVDGVTMHTPLNPANRHYAEILRQVAAGTLTIADAD